MAAMTPYLERYMAGEYERVWDELVALGAEVREEPLYSDALAVARETMRRARINIEMLIVRLRIVGYEFGYHWTQPLIEDDRRRAISALEDPVVQKIMALGAEDGIETDDRTGLEVWVSEQPPVFTPSTGDVCEKIQQLEAAVGPLPLALRAWYEVIGAVNFVGAPPQHWRDAEVYGLPDQEAMLDLLRSRSELPQMPLPPHDLDPLYVAPLDDALRRASIQERQHKLTHPFRMVVAPDEYFKYYVSGSGAYEIALPNLAADALLDGEWHNTTFVNYLRICFRWAGFPGLEQVPRAPAADSALLMLTRDLLPF